MLLNHINLLNIQQTMKDFIILYTILLILETNSHKQTFVELVEMFHLKILNHSENCINESGADPDLALRVIRYGEYVDDYKLKCFVKCIAENLYLINEDGFLDVENTLASLDFQDPQIVAQAGFIEKCFGLDGSDQCAKMYRISECMYQTIQNAMKDDSI